MAFFRKLRLFHRIVIHGVLLILAIAASAIMAFHVLGNPADPQNGMMRVAELITRAIAAGDGTKKDIETRLDPFYYVAEAPMAVYLEDGALIARKGDKLISPLSPQELRQLKVNDQYGKPYHREFGENAVPVTLPSGPGYLLISWKHADEIRWRFILAIAVSLLTIGLMSLPLARSIAKPVKALTETANKLKDGDLSARVTIESNDELAALGGTLNEMAEGLDRHIRREKELLANVSHELRTPLARIRVALELAEESAADRADLLDQLQAMGADVQELNQLVGDVLFSTRLDFSGKHGAPEFPLNLETAPLAPLLEETAAKFERDTGCAIHREFDGTPKVAVDRALFGRVIDNLLRNSRKYGDDAPEITLCLTTTPRDAVVAVKDRGIGVPPEHLNHLFEPFFRTDKSRARDAGGMGLGLTLAKRITEAHGGEIAASSREGGGLTVTVTLPLSTTQSDD